MDEGHTEVLRVGAFVVGGEDDTLGESEGEGRLVGVRVRVGRRGERVGARDALGPPEKLPSKGEAEGVVDRDSVALG